MSRTFFATQDDVLGKSLEKTEHGKRSVDSTDRSVDSFVYPRANRCLASRRSGSRRIKILRLTGVQISKGGANTGLERRHDSRRPPDSLSSHDYSVRKSVT